MNVEAINDLIRKKDEVKYFAKEILNPKLSIIQREQMTKQEYINIIIRTYCILS